MHTPTHGYRDAVPFSSPIGLSSPVIELSHVSVRFHDRDVLSDVSLPLQRGERWVIVGPNGCGKTTLLRTLSLYLHPSSGEVRVNGRALGTFDVRQVRPRISYASASLLADLRPALPARDVVMTARYGALEPWWHEYTSADHSRAEECLDLLGVREFAARPIGSLSSGEQQRVLIARAMMNDPVAVLLDEPSARLDLGGREQLVSLIDDLATARPELPMVLVTHHIDEIPSSFRHALVMRDGSALAQGPVDSSLTAHSLTAAFGVRLVVERRPNGRLTSYAPD